MTATGFEPTSTWFVNEHSTILMGWVIAKNEDKLGHIGQKHHIISITSTSYEELISTQEPPFKVAC